MLDSAVNSVLIYSEVNVTHNKSPVRSLDSCVVPSPKCLHSAPESPHSPCKNKILEQTEPLIPTVSKSDRTSSSGVKTVPKKLKKPTAVLTVASHSFGPMDGDGRKTARAACHRSGSCGIAVLVAGQ